MKSNWFKMAPGLLLRLLLRLLLGVLLVGGCAGVVLGLANGFGQASATAGTVTSTAVTGASPAQASPAQASAGQIAGEYSGSVKLKVTVAGVYSDTLAAPPAPGPGAPALPDLGSIDLSLQLAQTGTALSGYVNLDKTLIYSVEHTLGTGTAAIKIGPYVSGVFDGANLVLQSEQVGLVVSGRPVQRQFRLVGTVAAGDGGQVSGEYRETLWGYAPVPVTVIGVFTLQRRGFGSNVPVAGTIAPDAVADTATTAQGVPVTIDVLANDKDANGGVLTITSVSKPQFGTATTNGQTVTYTPNANFAGTDSFSYFVSNASGASAGGSVAVTVSGQNGPGGQGGPSLYLPQIRR